MPGDRGVVPQHRQDVHEAEHLHFDGLIFHGPVQQVVLPPAAVENGWRAMLQSFQQVAPNLLSALFDAIFDTRTFCHETDGGAVQWRHKPGDVSVGLADSLLIERLS